MCSNLLLELDPKVGTITKTKPNMLKITANNSYLKAYERVIRVKFAN